VAAARETPKRSAWPVVCFSFLDLCAEIQALTAGVREEPLLQPDFISSAEKHSVLAREAG
jgi:hypothetical protein